MALADVTAETKVTPDTLFQAASISKPVAAMAVLKAVQDGRFGLDQDVNTILTSWKVPASDVTATQPVTLRGLLSHTSGTDDGFGFPGYKPARPFRRWCRFSTACRRPTSARSIVTRPPLTSFKYSGGGVTLVQLLMTDVMKRPFHEMMRDTVLKPLGMAHSAYEQPLSAERDRQAARAHDRNGAARDVKWHVYPELAAAGLWTTSPDLARFGIELQKSIQGESNRVLNRAMANEMASPVGVGPFAIGMQMNKMRRGLVHRSRRLELGVPVPLVRAQDQRLWLRGDDQRRRRRPPDRRAPAARRGRVQVGHARSAACAGDARTDSTHTGPTIARRRTLSPRPLP